MEDNSHSKLDLFYADRHNVEFVLNEQVTIINRWVTEGHLGFMGTSWVENFVIPNIKSVGQNSFMQSEKIADDNLNYLIIGQGGSGKTILIKHLAKKIVQNVANYRHPILIKGTDLTHKSIFQTLNDIFNLKNAALREDYLSTTILFNILRENRIILFIDGIDESPVNPYQLIEEINLIAENFKELKLVITSRYLFSELNRNFEKVEVLPLNENQIHDFLIRELKSEKSAEMLMTGKWRDMLRYPYLAMLLINIYESYGRLPSAGIDVYRLIVSMFVERWNSQNIKRHDLAQIDGDKIVKLLSALAFNMSIQQKTGVSESELKSFIESDIVTLQTGENLDADLLTKIFVLENLLTDNNNWYTFAHRSIQEYLAATYLVLLPFGNYGDYIKVMPDVTALAVLLSSDQVYYLAVIFDMISSQKGLNGELIQFFKRLFTEASDPVYKRLFLLASEFAEVYDENLKNELLQLDWRF